MDLVAGQGLKVSRRADNLLPTPTAVDGNTVAKSELDGDDPKHRLKVAAQVLARDALLPTVTTSEANGVGAHGDGGQDLRTTIDALLPTPTVIDMGGNKTPAEWEAWTDEQRAKHANGNGHGASLNIEAIKLMPTPNTMDGLPRRSDEALARAKASGGVSNLKDAEIVRNPVEGNNWGKFAPAIERWEQTIDRPAPAPTKPDGKDGAHRLSSEFTEWMMGLPAGWITGVGLSRNEELKACGNGVVPQQAELALRILLEGLPVERERERTVMFPTPTVSDTYTDNLASTQQKAGSMHSVTLPQAVRMVDGVE